MDLRSSFDSLNLGDSESNEEGLWGHLSLRPDGRYVRLDSEGNEEEISKEPPVGQLLVVKKEGLAYTSDPPAAVFQEPEDSRPPRHPNSKVSSCSRPIDHTTAYQLTPPSLSIKDEDDEKIVRHYSRKTDRHYSRKTLVGCLFHLKQANSRQAPQNISVSSLQALPP